MKLLITFLCLILTGVFRHLRLHITNVVGQQGFLIEAKCFCLLITVLFVVLNSRPQIVEIFGKHKCSFNTYTF